MSLMSLKQRGTYSVKVTSTEQNITLIRNKKWTEKKKWQNLLNEFRKFDEFRKNLKNVLEQRHITYAQLSELIGEYKIVITD